MCNVAEGAVRITEQGVGAYVFCSEGAAFEARLMDAVGRGVADIGAGRYVTSVEEAFARADEMRARRA